MFAALNKRERPHLAAESSAGVSFVKLLGGPFCGQNQRIGLAKLHQVAKETGEVIGAVLNKYSEPTLGKIYGVL